MTLLTTGLHGTPTSGCLPQYAISDDLFCAGRINGLDINDNGGTITISSGSAYVKVEDSTGVEFLVKVYNDSDITITKSANSDIVINVPLANVQNATNNLDYSDIASIEVVPNGTGGDFHLVLATLDVSNNVSEVNNSGHYLPGCDFCMRCQDGVLQLPDVNASDITATSITAGDIEATGSFIGDGSGITNITPDSLIIETNKSPVMIGETVSEGDYLRYGISGNEVIENLVQDSISATGSSITQTFTSASTALILNDEIDIYLGGNLGNTQVSIEIYDASNNLLGTTGTVLVNAPGLNTYTLQSPTTVPAGAGNYIQVNYISGGSNNSFVYGLSNTNEYSGGSYSGDANKDITFSIELDSAESLTKLYKTDATSPLKIDWVGVACEGGNDGDTIYMITGPVDNTQSGLNTRDVMYLSDTPGQVSNITGTNTKEVGFAINSETILFERDTDVKTRLSLSDNTNYIAERDGTVNAFTISNTSSTRELEGYVNGTLISGATSVRDTSRYAISFEVLKGEQYRVQFNGLPVTFAEFIG